VVVGGVWLVLCCVVGVLVGGGGGGGVGVRVYVIDTHAHTCRHVFTCAIYSCG